MSKTKNKSKKSEKKSKKKSKTRSLGSKNPVATHTAVGIKKITYSSACEFFEVCGAKILFGREVWKSFSAIERLKFMDAAFRRVQAVLTDAEFIQTSSSQPDDTSSSFIPGTPDFIGVSDNKLIRDESCNI